MKLITGKPAIAKTDIASGEKGSIYTAGVVDVSAPESLEFAKGDIVWWDVSERTAAKNSTGEDDYIVGVAILAKAVGEIYVRTVFRDETSRYIDQVLVSDPGAPNDLLLHDFEKDGSRMQVIIPAGTIRLGQTIRFAGAGRVSNCKGAPLPDLEITPYFAISVLSSPWITVPIVGTAGVVNVNYCFTWEFNITFPKLTDPTELTAVMRWTKNMNYTSAGVDTLASGQATGLTLQYPFIFYCKYQWKNEVSPLNEVTLYHLTLQDLSS